MQPYPLRRDIVSVSSSKSPSTERGKNAAGAHSIMSKSAYNTLKESQINHYVKANNIETSNLPGSSKVLEIVHDIYKVAEYDRNKKYKSSNGFHS